MGKRTAPPPQKKASRRVARPPTTQGYGERAYGGGSTPTLYNGQPSPLAPQATPVQAMNTASGQFSPSAAPNSGAGMLGSTEASLLPAGENPMTIFAQTHPKFPGVGQG